MLLQWAISWPPTYNKNIFFFAFSELESAVGRLHHQSHKAARLSEVSRRLHANSRLIVDVVLITFERSATRCCRFSAHCVKDATCKWLFIIRKFSHINCWKISFVSIVERRKSRDRIPSATDFNASHDILWWLLTFSPAGFLELVN